MWSESDFYNFVNKYMGTDTNNGTYGSNGYTGVNSGVQTPPDTSGNTLGPTSGLVFNTETEYTVPTLPNITIPINNDTDHTYRPDSYPGYSGVNTDRSTAILTPCFLQGAILYM
jgi:hypothetical protein